MRRKFLTTFIAVCCLTSCIWAFSGCEIIKSIFGIFGNAENGTYYIYRGGQLDKSVYITLSNGDWEDNDNMSGTYKVSGEDITFYTIMMGEETEFVKGKISDGKLSLASSTYYKEDSQP